MPPEPDRFDEYRVRFRDPATGADVSHDVTSDPRQAGKDYRDHRAILGGGPGEISLEKRTVTRSPWEPVERVSLADEPN